MKLKSICILHNIKIKELKDLLNTTYGTTSLKVNNKSIITTEEAIKIKKYINDKSGMNYSLEDLFEE